MIRYIRTISILTVLTLYSLHFIKLFGLGQEKIQIIFSKGIYGYHVFTSLVQNNEEGAELVFSNYQVYRIAPSDRVITAFWLSPVNVKIERIVTTSEFPWRITNLVSNQSVMAQLVERPFSSELFLKFPFIPEG